MHKIILVLTLILGIHFHGLAQFDVKSEAQILQGIEWLTTNPVDETNSLFVGYVLDNSLYQMVTYPDFPMNFEALSEFMAYDNSYKYLVEINMVFTANMLAQKIESGKSFDLQKASYQSMKKVMNYYKLLIKAHPNQSNKVLHEYSALSSGEFEKKVNSLVKK